MTPSFLLATEKCGAAIPGRMCCRIPERHWGTFNAHHQAHQSSNIDRSPTVLRTKAMASFGLAKPIPAVFQFKDVWHGTLHHETSANPQAWFRLNVVDNQLQVDLEWRAGDRTSAFTFTEQDCQIKGIQIELFNGSEFSAEWHKRAAVDKKLYRPLVQTQNIRGATRIGFYQCVQVKFGRFSDKGKVVIASNHDKLLREKGASFEFFSSLTQSCLADETGFEVTGLTVVNRQIMVLKDIITWAEGDRIGNDNQNVPKGLMRPSPLIKKLAVAPARTRTLAPFAASSARSRKPDELVSQQPAGLKRGHSFDVGSERSSKRSRSSVRSYQSAAAKSYSLRAAANDSIAECIAAMTDPFALVSFHGLTARPSSRLRRP